MIPPDSTTPRTLADEEQRQADYYRTLYDLEQKGEVTEFTIGPRTLFDLVALLQLGLRHPGVSRVMRDRMTALAYQLGTPFAGTLGAELIAAGFNPDYDFAPAPSPGREFGQWLAGAYPDGGPRSGGLYGEDELYTAYNAGRVAGPDAAVVPE